MEFNPIYHKYSSKRNLVYGKNGMVAASHPLAAQAGIDMMKKGGNAVDAAIATAATLTVVEPTANGIGGDAFALVWTNGKLHGLNSSGPSPKSLTYEKLKELGLDSMPVYGFTPVTVPGVPAAWAELSKKFGKLTLKEALMPAIGIARDGHPIAPTVGKYWDRAYRIYSEKLKGEEFKYWFETFAPKGRAPKIGEIWLAPDHAATLEEIANTNAESFYRGELADKIDEFSRKYGGYIRKEDLAEYKAEWVEPIKVNYRGYDVWEIPPNGHGIVALMALNILNNFELKEKDSIETYHILIEAMKLAFADGLEYIGDPKYMVPTVEELLSPEYGKERAKLIGESALMPEAGEPQSGGTVYFATADGEGNMVSYIQSNYMGFGSGLVVPGTGIGLHNRGNNFNMKENHPNCVGPCKKPYHTIISGFLSKDGRPVGPFGVMGGFMQPQGHVQVITSTIDFHLNPQDALDAPRWQWTKDKTISVEQSFPNDIALALGQRGHNMVSQIDSGSFGRGQIIWVDEKGVLCGGTESRADGYIAIF
ncbi:gamma-glutamyltransferase [Tissierella sp.]|uniref:gamma-glutamyltransferase n=1 Tax=Tissierella sp. TaxID=41274 RepID=UPI0028548008|nr:gamma-glutamyltransferase [Tissierella sp.]MDR7856975.1 gamma-glutamyltransferase [Tissierella sp.]